MEQPESTLPVQATVTTAIETKKPEKKTGDAFCRQCGETISQYAEICPKCGVRQKSEKNPGTAAVLSFLVVGLGQIYNGEIGKGLLFMFIAVICFLLISVVIGLFMLPGFWIFNIFEAYATAKKMSGEN
jgi:TM2 domain-containing membrane protein YozV